jgi:hypothetical protein
VIDGGSSQGAAWHDRTPRLAPHPSRLARFAHSRLRTPARCAIGAAATIYRNYFALVRGGSPQRTPAEDLTLARQRLKEVQSWQKT